MNEDTKNRFWDRNQLYEEVWNEPVVKVAQRYGISDVAIAKICRKLQIPLPGRGYWAKKEHGHSVQRTPLPELKDPPRLEKPVPSARPQIPEHGEDKAEFERIDYLLANGAFALPANSNVLEHPLIRAAAKALPIGGEDSRHILSPPYNQACLDIRVSKKSLHRALSIAGQLIAILENHQCKVIVDSQTRQQTIASCGGTNVRFILREKVKQLPASSKTGTSPISRQFEYETTGQLSVDIEEYADGQKKKWSDTETLNLEELIPQCVVGILKVAVVLRRHHRERQERELASKKREIERAELFERVKEERARVKHLKQTVCDWFLAQEIREFIVAMETKNVQAGPDHQPEPELVEWLRWAKEQADRIDPLIPSPPSVLDREHEVASLERSPYGQSDMSWSNLEMERQERTRYFWMGWWKSKRNR